MVRAISIIVILIANAQSLSATEAPVHFQDIGPIEADDAAIYRLGNHDRIFIIEDQWEYDRCKLLLPKLPAIDFKSESLLVFTSPVWAKRSLDSIEVDENILAIKIEQEEPQKINRPDGRRPDFRVYKIPFWNGPVRFDLNGHATFTLARGQELKYQSDVLWEEFLRVHSGGRPTNDQLIRHYKRMWRGRSNDEIRHLISDKGSKYRNVEPAIVYQMIGTDLSNIRAKPVVPKIFALIDTMGMHDKAFDPSWKAIVGIGGEDAVEGCKLALKSWNPRSRHAGMLILRDFGLPNTKSLALEHLSDLQLPIARCAMDLLNHIGIEADDVPAMSSELEKIMTFYSTPPADRPKVDSYGGDVADSIMYALGELGPNAKAALPTLERINGDDRLPKAFRSKAKETIVAIQGSAR